MRYGSFALALLGATALAVPGAARAQADSAPAVSAAGASLMRLNTDASLVVRGVEGEGVLPASGGGVRMMWFPSQAAFRAGRLGVYDLFDGTALWDQGSLGLASAAFGTNNRASGTNSFAAGYRASATAERTLAFNGTASATGAIALGNGAQATNDDAVAMGPSSIAGGLASIVLGPSIANGNFGVAIGLQNSASGQFSVAIGKNARTANRQGSVVLGDGCAGFSSDSVFPTANNQVVMRGCGGVKVFTNQGLTSGVELAAGGSGWSAVSDRNRKENFLGMEGEDVLARLRSVPVTSWNYRSQDRSIRHMGPMAQDFYAAFGLGESELMINSVDIDGVNMAAIQALTARTDALQAENATLRQENAEMRARLERIEALLAGQGTAPAQP
jgi:hypothetical protein